MKARKGKAKQAVLIQTSGLITAITPDNGKDFSLKELQGYVGGLIDVAYLPSGKVMVVNDEGKLNGLPKNDLATEIWKQEYPKAAYPWNNDELIVGDVVMCDNKLVK